MNLREFSCLTGIATAALLLSACGGTDESSPDGSSESSSASASSSPTASPTETPSPAPSPTETDAPPSATPSPTEPPSTQTPAAPPTAAPTPQPTAAPPEPGTQQADRSERGYLMKDIGEESYINDSTGTPAVSFAVTDVVADPVCSAPYAQPSENGHLVRLDIDLQTGSAASLEEVLYTDSYYLSASDWKFVDAEGVRANTTDSVASWMCLETDEQFPLQIGPHERIRGSIVLDLPSTSGTLIYTQPLIDDGWEWSIGQ